MGFEIAISKKDLYRYLLIVFSSIVALFVISISQSLAYHIIAIWFLCFVAISVVRFDLLHPYVWFSIILSLYSSAYAILILLFGFNGSYDRKQLLLPTIALAVTLIFIGPKKRITTNELKTATNKTSVNYKYLDYIIILLFVLCIIFSIVLFKSGYSGKNEMKQANVIYYRIGIYIARFLTFFTIIRIINCIGVKVKYLWIIILTGVATLLFSFSTGERDIFIRYFVVLLFILYSANKIKKIHFLIIIPVSMMVLVLSVEFKYFFLTNSLNGSFSLDNILEGFLTSDFSAAGRNLQYLLECSWTECFFGFKLLLSELFYPILPSSIRINPDYWFNYVVHSGGYHGNAFTLVGTGYIINGIIGVIIVFAIVGIIIRCLYKYSNRSIFSFSAYIYSITIMMIAMRGSLNSIVNCLVKEVLICLLLCRFANKILYKNH